MKLNELVLIIYFILTLNVATTTALPAANILRWFGSILLLFIGLLSSIKRDKSFSIWPRYFNYLIPTFIVSIITLDYALVIGVFKIISFVLVVSSLHIFMNRSSIRPEMIKKGFTIMSYVLFLIMLYQFIILLITDVEFGYFSGIYGNKNILSSIALSAIVGGVWLVLNSHYKKTSFLIYIVPSVMVLLAAGSRMGIVGLLVIIISVPFIMFEFKNNRQKLKVLLQLLILIFLALIVIKYLNIPAVERILSPEQADGSTGLSRGDTWLRGFKIFSEKPLFGWGYGSVHYHVFEKNLSGLIGWGVHNTYLIILIENGIIGSLFYLLFFTSAFYKLSSLYKKSKDIYFVKITSLLCFVLLINGFTEGFLFAVGNPMAIPFWYSFISLNSYLNEYNM